MDVVGQNFITNTPAYNLSIGACVASTTLVYKSFYLIGHVFPYHKFTIVITWSSCAFFLVQILTSNSYFQTLWNLVSHHNYFFWWQKPHDDVGEEIYEVPSFKWVNISNVYDEIQGIHICIRWNNKYRHSIYIINNAINWSVFLSHNEHISTSTKYYLSIKILEVWIFHLVYC